MGTMRSSCSAGVLQMGGNLGWQISGGFGDYGMGHTKATPALWTYCGSTDTLVPLAVPGHSRCPRMVSVPQVSLVLWEKPSFPTLLLQLPQSHLLVQVRGSTVRLSWEHH